MRRFSLWWLACLGVLIWTGCRAGPDPAALATDHALDWTLGVRADGPHWLSPDWWQAQGLDPDSLDPARVGLYSEGARVPTLWLDSPQGPGLLFWAQTSVDPRLGPLGAYTLTVTSTDAEPLSIPGFLGDALVFQETTSVTTRLESDLVYRSTAPLDSPWLWTVLYAPTALTLTVPLTDAISAPLTLTVQAWGQSGMPESPDHHVQVRWNGVLVGDHVWDGAGVEVWSMSVPQARAGDNGLVLEVPGDTEASVEVLWLDAIEVTWQRALRSAGESVTWSAGGVPGACLEMPEGEWRALFAAQSGQIYDGGSFSSSGGTPVCLPQPAGAHGWIGVPWETPSPALVRPRQTLTPSVLLEADYLVVAPAAFHEALAPLLDVRRAEGYQPLLLTPEQVYDTYGNGIPDVASLQAMAAALQVQGNLRYLLLVGDASADPRAVWETEDSVYLPTAWVRTDYLGDTASDYALVAGEDAIPSVAVGRFPVSTVAEVEALVAKTLAWQSNTRLLLLNDDEAEFRGLNDALATMYPVDLRLDAVDDNSRRDLLRWLRDGPGTLVYAGHGSLPMLGDEKLLTREDAGAWDGPTVVIAWTCLCSSFGHPTQMGLSELWLRDRGNAVGIIGPTAETTTPEQSAMAKAVQASLAAGGTLGDAMLAGWRAAAHADVAHADVAHADVAHADVAHADVAHADVAHADVAHADVRASFVLLGDPALRPLVPVEQAP